MDGETDSQLINSVYLDNYATELYQGRLEKSPGAIALRFRWYGNGNPDIIFVERKTHRESWTGDVSVKERFIIKESQVQSLLAGKFDLDGEVRKLQAKGKSEEDIAEYTKLAKEVIQAVNSKQLVPTMRTQYMRTAFQIPFDATVRVSLDTNLCMISERTSDTIQGKRWFRDPNKVVPLNEITRFPHGVLEIKLQLEDEGKTPEWVNDLLNSGKLLEVHKFSKFIHGCAVLMPEEVRAVPYWIDDATLADSIIRSGAGKLIEDSVGANEYYQQLLPHNDKGEVKPELKPSKEQALQLEKAKKRYKPKREQIEEGDRSNPVLDPNDEGAREGWNGYDLSFAECQEQCCDWATSAPADHMTFQKVEPKLFFANERTFLSWLHMAVILSSISIGVLAFTSKNSKTSVFLFLGPVL
jgi:hypothetical protein